MSWQLALLNRQLRWLEKPALAKHPVPRLRRSFEFKSKLYFHAPRGTTYRRDRLGGVDVQWVTARHAKARGTVLLYLHGGAYVFGSSDTHRAMLARLSALTGLPACLPDYRLAPEHPFPAQIDDALTCYKELRAEHEVIIGGDSAGGGLALSLLHEIGAQDLPKPRAVFAFSPVVDLTFAGESVTQNAQSDVVLTPTRIDEMIEMFLGDQDPKDPRASPLFGDFKGAPPVWLAAGDTEVLYDDSRRMHDALLAQGVHSTLEIAPNHPHVWPLFHNVLPEAKATLQTLAQWIAARLT